MTLSHSNQSTVKESDNTFVLVRAFADHTPKWQRFQAGTKSSPEGTSSHMATDHNFPFQRQYAHVYHQRLAALKSRCWESIDRVGTGVPGKESSNTDPRTRVSRILELREDIPSQVVGTLVKECGSPQEDCLWPTKKCRPADYLVLEDESGRVSLDFEPGCSDEYVVHQYCTGLVVGVSGIVGANGVMRVERIHSPFPVAHPTVLPKHVRIERDAHVLLLSGLQLGNPTALSLARDMLLTYLDGMLQRHAAGKICRVVIAGGSIDPRSIAGGIGSQNSGTVNNFHSHHHSVGSASTTPRSIQELDAFCAQILAMGIPVDLIPGRDDPTTATWPQRPLHSSLFPYSRALSAAPTAANFYQTPNPYAAIWGNKFVLGTDGTNIADLLEHTNLSKWKTAGTASVGDHCDNGSTDFENDARSGNEELTALGKTLEWGHLCPTGPDSVPTTPHAESDPLVIRETPHIYFMGNATCFSTNLVNGSFDEAVDTKVCASTTKTRLICIPKFCQTGQAVLLSLETSDVHLLRFVAPQGG